MAVKKSRKQIYEGKAKILYEGPEPGTFIQHFKDDATAFNGKKKEIIAGKGILNNRISEFIMSRLAEVGIRNHYIKTLNMREQLIKQVEIIPLEVVVRNYAAGSFTKRYGVPEGTQLGAALVEFFLKKDKLGDPLVTEECIQVLKICDHMEMQEMKNTALRVNDFLFGMFMAVGIRVIDFKLEFGRFDNGEFIDIILADEISPDSCRLWDSQTNRKLDKDRFRQDLGGVEDAYKEVAKRLGVFSSEGGRVDEIIKKELKIKKGRKSK